MQLLGTGYSIPSPPAVGDLILFGGHSMISNVIRYVTDKKNHAVSHCAVMISPTTLVESTTLNGENGVGAIPLEHWLEDYPGEVWIKYLNVQAAKQLDAARLVNFLTSQEGRPYDKTQVLFAALGIDAPQSWGREKWYCSELAIAAYKEGGIVPVNYFSGITPAALGDLRIFDKQAWQMKGKLKELK